MRNMAILLALCSLLAGCAHVISKESMALVDTSITFRMVKENPGGYAGKYVLLGGIIAVVRNNSDGGEIEIVQHDLDSRGRPETSDMSAGRFLAHSNGFLDPLVFLTGLPISVVGRVEGDKTLPLDGIAYRYPVISIKEVRLLKPDQDSPYPVFHFGVRFGHVF
ncbi:MAG: Slp family lipoprotein [Geobacteraceae bacterium]|nr:Slp family lipoprotein [Geobacteraceae bacterium]